jgi:queuosine precursor transporter
MALLIEKNHMNYKYLPSIAMVYMTLKLTTILLIYKIINIGPFSASASTIIMPFWFFCGGIIAETYGYKTAKNLIWVALICQLLFALICTCGLSLDINSHSQHDQALANLPRVTISSFLAVVSGGFINAYIITKWKIIFHGKYFWIRSLFASTIGEFVFTFVAYLCEFLGMVPFSKLMELMMFSFTVKILLNPILIIPSWMISNALRQSEQSDPDDDNVSPLNPFT